MVEIEVSATCAACGTDLSQERETAGLCPVCLIELALDDTGLEAELEPDEAPTLQFTAGTMFAEGEIQGDRYRIRSLLGRGGMGEVWRAYDLKLRQDVALKALRAELIEDEAALEILRQEVRVAREVISPNVCRVFDLQELDGQELISMEYVDGTTVQEILRERGPLELNEAREIATQFLAGLEAIHEAGLVHRDIKPENLMLTRTGRVVVMDFGIAKGLGEGKGGVVAGTPAYMSPEQARGQELDARSDLFSAGVVLAEMVEPGGIATFEDRKRVWESVHRDTPQISDTPWSKVIAKCVSAETRDRFESAAALARALEEVTLRAAGDETARPYPGLSAFQQQDAEYFYGRELEVEALWKKLRRPHLLAVIGPSGAGKSSLLRAGLLPTLTDGWQALIATPGTRPFVNLARALAEQLPEDRSTVDALLRFDEPKVALDLISSWHQGHDHSLLILDQFEELFTQNPDDTQRAFTELLGRLPLEADVFVLLSMRDDFLFHCQAFESLAPVFSEMTPLGPPTGASLRRAVVEPALNCGYRFEDESIVEEMLGEVEGQRGALPLLAFAAAQLWERRDRESGLLTRKAYEQIGGVSGALAQHAEAMLDYIGQANVPIVRELFRNLVTAQGTRASRERDELLSVFPETEGEPFLEPSEVRPAPAPKPQRPAAKHVLNSLIDARLLTSFEIPADEEGGESQHRIEIVHESLLANWPRLVRWQRQDADSAQMRDELRAQAKLWDEHSRLEDYLWTGTAFKEYALWRESYPGGLTAVEDEFGAAMVHLAERQKRRRRIAISAAFGILLVVLGVIGWFGWQAELERRRAEAETVRAEASKLLAIAQLRFEEDPTEALAYATASLELNDTEQTRLFALRTLWEAPPALELAPGSEDADNLRWPAFSPDGTSLAVAGHADEAWVWTQEGRVPPLSLPGHRSTPQGSNVTGWASNELLVTSHHKDEFARVWRIPGGELARKVDYGAGDAQVWRQVGRDHLLTELIETDPVSSQTSFHLRSWTLPDGGPEDLGRVNFTELGASVAVFDLDGSGWWYVKGNDIFYRPLPANDQIEDRWIGTHENEATLFDFPTEVGRIWSQDTVTGELRLWSNADVNSDPLRVIQLPPGTGPDTQLSLDPSHRRALVFRDENQARIWDLEMWNEARPLTLRRRASWKSAMHTFHPRGNWLAISTATSTRITMWPLAGKRPWVADGYQAVLFRPIGFTPDGKWLATWWQGDSFWLWPLPGNDSKEVLKIAQHPDGGRFVGDIDPKGRFLLAGGFSQPFVIVPLDGSPPRTLEGFWTNSVAQMPTISPSGNLVAAAPQHGEDKTLRVWDVETGTLRSFDLPLGSPGVRDDLRAQVWNLAFVDDSTLYTAGIGGVRIWDLETGEHELVYEVQGEESVMAFFSPDRRRALIGIDDLLDDADSSPGMLLDLETGAAKELPAFPAEGNGWACFGPSSEIIAITGDSGIIRVGKLSGGEPHLLLGHEGSVQMVQISPDGQWIASTGEDNTLRLWPMPDLDKPPLHILPHEELIAKLKSLTNIRVVRDPDADEGWSVALDPFPGWAEVPEWP